MEKRMIVTIFFLLILFLASPLFGGLVGAIPLSEEEVAALRKEYPIQKVDNPMADYTAARSFSRDAQKAATFVYCEVTDISTVPITGCTAYIVRVIDDSRGLFPKNAVITIGQTVLAYHSRYFELGERFAAPIVYNSNSQKDLWSVQASRMYYVTEDEYVLSVFDESDDWINYDERYHSGMTVQALLRKYIAWDGVPSASDFETPTEADNWLKQWGYYPYDE